MSKKDNEKSKKEQFTSLNEGSQLFKQPIFVKPERLGKKKKDD